MVKLSVGIDIAKETFQACIMMRHADGRQVVLSNKNFGNRTGGFTALLNWVKRCTPKGYVGIKTIYVMEATGVYYEQLSYFLSDQSLNVSVQLANNVKNFGKSLNIKTKTDKSDAEVIALMGIERQLPLWEAPTLVYRQLKQLNRERLALVEQKTVVQNQKSAIKSSHEPNLNTIKRMDEHIDFIEDQIQDIEEQLKKVVASDPVLQKKFDNVCTIKGVQFVTAVTVIAECNGFKLFKNKGQLVSFAGYDVVKKESGKKEDKNGHISKKGNRFIRRALYFPAVSAIRYDSNFKNVADRITDTTKIKMKGNVAVQRRLLVLIYKLFVNNTVYDINYQENKVKELQNQGQNSHLKQPILAEAA
jgi:transposase